MTATTTHSADVHRLRTGMLLAIGGTFFFALKSIVIKSAYSTGADASQVLTARMLLSAPFFLALLAREKFSSPKPVAFLDIAKAVGLGFFGYYLASLLDMEGLELISAQLERLTLFTYPTMVACLAWFFLKEHLGWQVIASLVTCYLGICIMYLQEASWADSQSVMTGIFLVLGSALSYSLYVVCAKPIITRIGSVQFTCYAMLSSSFLVVLHYTVIKSSTFDSIKGTVWTHGLFLAFVCTVIPSFMVNESIHRIGATRTTIVGSVGPVLTMLLAVLILGEPTSIWHAIGMVIVIAGVSLVSIKKK